NVANRIKPCCLGLSEIESSQVSSSVNSVASSLCNRNDPGNRRNVKHFTASIGPLDFQFIDLRGRTQTKVQRHITLRTKNRSTHNVLPLPHVACCQINNTSDRIARTLFGHVADQSQAQPMTTRRCNVA